MLSTSGSYDKTSKWLTTMSDGGLTSDLDRYGAMGVRALAAATPTESGLTARSWGYRIVSGRKGDDAIIWYNTNEVNGTSIAILLQYGHGTGTGGFVSGRDYINPALRSVYEQIVSDLSKKVIG